MENNSKKKAFVVCVSTEKGGVGKTSLSAAFVSLGAKRGLKSVLLDLDKQGNGTEALGAEPDKPGAKEYILQEPYEIQGGADGKDIGILCSSMDLDGGRIISLHPEHLHDTMDRSIADLIVIDCPPTNLPIQRMAIACSDVCVIPTDQSSYGIKAVSTVVGDLEVLKSKKRPGPNEWCIVASKVNRSIVKHKTLKSDIEGIFPGMKVFEVSQDQKVCDAGDEGRGLFQYASTCRAAKEIEDIFDWFFPS